MVKATCFLLYTWHIEYAYMYIYSVYNYVNIEHCKKLAHTMRPPLLQASGSHNLFLLAYDVRCHLLSH